MAKGPGKRKLLKASLDSWQESWVLPTRKTLWEWQDTQHDHDDSAWRTPKCHSWPYCLGQPDWPPKKLTELEICTVFLQKRRPTRYQELQIDRSGWPNPDVVHQLPTNLHSAFTSCHEVLRTSQKGFGRASRHCKAASRLAKIWWAMQDCWERTFTWYNSA